ncbi:MAG: serine--tRNA ligase [Deltaproteobacteria bacterium]|jgi:seryl-tRNA synthetase|nr:serine--tRNA ligase [Deltaproteobacteria bacterium]
MHDLKFVRENIGLLKETLAKRRMDPSLLDRYQELDARRRALLSESEGLQARRNGANAEMARLKKAGEDAGSLLEELKGVSQRLKEQGPLIAEAEEAVQEILRSIPNLVSPDAPDGPEGDFRIEKSWGAPREFAFRPLNHWEIGEANGLLDLPRAAKVAGARFAVLFGKLARLNRAIISLMLDLHTGRHGYRECWPPAVANAKSLFGTGQLPKFEEDLFSLEGTGWYLIPTAEVPVTNLYRDETIPESELPVSLCAYTPCFRAEAGAAGKDTRGLIRMHQFDKVELVRFAHPSSSAEELELLVSHAEAVLEAIGLPYRRVTLPTGDLGFSSFKTYDLEVWLPGAGTYREISSCSCFTDFQARRAGIRYKPKGAAKAAYLHTLNGSGLAVGRTLAAILENFQNEDGSVGVPEALRPYMGGDSVIEGPPGGAAAPERG